MDLNKIKEEQIDRWFDEFGIIIIQIAKRRMSQLKKYLHIDELDEILNENNWINKREYRERMKNELENVGFKCRYYKPKSFLEMLPTILKGGDGTSFRIYWDI